MLEQVCVSVIVPFYNSEKYIKNCLSTLLAQDFKKPFEIIMVDDASTDSGEKIIKLHKIPLLQLFSLPSNIGQSAARNIGIKNAKGKYIFLLDVDDELNKNTLTTLYDIAEKEDCDFVFSDYKRIEKSQNQRSNIFNYPDNEFFETEEILEAMRKELYEHNPLYGHLGLFGCNGRLIKRSIIYDNKISFCEELRFLEDKTFAWDVLGFVKKARYVREQLYSYHVYPNVSTAVIDGVNRGFPMNHFKLVQKHIQNSLRHRGLTESKIEKFGDQGLIFFIISLLVSYSRCIALGKVEFKKGIESRKRIISEIINDVNVSKAIKNYYRSKKESYWIPKAIAWRSQFLLELACTIRGKETIKMRRKGTK